MILYPLLINFRDLGKMGDIEYFSDGMIDNELWIREVEILTCTMFTCWFSYTLLRVGASLLKASAMVQSSEVASSACQKRLYAGLPSE